MNSIFSFFDYFFPIIAGVLISLGILVGFIYSAIASTIVSVALVAIGIVLIQHDKDNGVHYCMAAVIMFIITIFF